jgi:transketolase
VEDNYGAGMGSAVAAALAEHEGRWHLKQMHVRRIPKSGRTPDDVLGYLGLSADNIVRTAAGMLEAAVR